MAGFQQITIAEAIREIETDKYLIPAFQREYVWSGEQVERLFDSIMRGYPISSMLFWKVRSESAEQWKFYSFLRYFREWYHTHNEYKPTKSIGEFSAILDGQQRLTSLYLALCGDYHTHRPYKKWENTDDKFKICELYFNLTTSQEPKNDNVEYEFLWLEKAETGSETIYTDKFGQKWFRCKDIYPHSNNDVKAMEIQENFGLSSKETKNLALFEKRVFSEDIISFYQEDDQNPEKAVNIFIRINSGGTHLSYSDILFSYAIANWKQKDARKEINELVDFINDSKGFNISKDLVLKAFLYLYHENIKFDIGSFNNGFIENIEQQWDNIKIAFHSIFDLLENFGFNAQTMSSNNAILPALYYVYHKNLASSIVHGTGQKQTREVIKKYLLRATLFKPFGGSADSVLTATRKVFKKDFDGKVFFDDNIYEFPLESIEKSYKYNNTIDDDFLQDLMLYRKNSPEAFAVLSILYPNLDTKNNFHKDHLHPESKYKEYKKLMEKNKKEYYDFSMYDALPNLQLLDANENMAKNDKSLEEWVESECRNKDKSKFLKDHLIPDVDLSLDNFDDFYEKREKLMISKLRELL